MDDDSKEEQEDSSGIKKEYISHRNRTKTESERTEAASREADGISLDRRHYLKGAVAASIASLSVMTGSASAQERHGIDFDQVVDAVDDLGMDPNGNQAIDSALQRSMDRGNELVEFPPGEYLVSDGVAGSSVNNWGIVGLGTDPSDVRFLHTGSAGINFIRTNGGTGHLVENVTLDYSSQRQGSLGMMLRGNDEVYAIDVHYVGFNPTTENGDITNLAIMAFDSDGEAVADGLVRKGPTNIASHASQGPPSNSAFCWLGGKHEGTLTVRNWHIENTGSNVLYASRINGAVQVEDCTFVNNNQSSVRISGDNSYVHNCEFVIDTDNDHPDNEYAEGDYINPHAMMWESGNEGRSGADVEGCDIIYRSRPNNGRFLQAIRGLGSIGDFEVRDTRFQIDTAETSAIYAQDPQNPSFGSTAAQPWDVTIDSVSITGSGNASHGAIELHNRSDSVITDSCLHLTGDQDGVVITDSSGCRIEDTSITVEGEETVFSNAGVDTINLTSDESCPLPDFSDDDEEDDTDDGNGDDGDDGSDGDDGDDGDSSELNELVIHGPGRDADVTRIDYRIAYEGEATPLTGREANIHDGYFEGSVWYDFTDSFEIDGDVTNVEQLSDEATLEYNGQVVDPEEFPIEDDDGDNDENEGSDDDDGDDEENNDEQQPYPDSPMTIPGRIQAQDFDEGGQDVAYYDTTEENRGGEYRPDEFVDIEDSRESIGEYSIGFVDEGEWLEYTVDVEPGIHDISAVVSTPHSDVQFAVILDGVRIGTVTAPNSGDWFNWETVTFEDVEIDTEGTSTLRIEFLDAGVNLNWIDFEQTGDAGDDDGDDDSDGDDGDDSDTLESNELVIHGPGRDADVTRIDYRIAYEGEATPLTGREANIHDGYFEGSVWYDFTDSFEIDGDVTNVEQLSDEATLEYNGQVVDPEEFPIEDDDESQEDDDDGSDEDDEDDSSDLPHAILVDGTVTDEVTSYSISVTGELEPSEELSEGQDRSEEDGLPDSVSGGTVDGVVKEGIDGYRFSGDITQMHIDGNASVDLSIE